MHSISDELLFMVYTTDDDHWLVRKKIRSWKYSWHRNKSEFDICSTLWPENRTKFLINFSLKVMD